MKLAEAINGCGVFVNSTIRENGYDLTILQAMACGCPVVASDIKSVCEVIDHGADGLLFPRHDIVKLAEAIGMFIASPELMRTCGTQARQKIEQHYGLEVMARKTIEVYNAVQGVSRG